MKFARRAANVQTAKRKPSVGDTVTRQPSDRMNGDELEKAHIKGQLQGLRAALRQQPGSARQVVQKPQPHIKPDTAAGGAGHRLQRAAATADTNDASERGPHAAARIAAPRDAASDAYACAGGGKEEEARRREARGGAPPAAAALQQPPPQNNPPPPPPPVDVVVNKRVLAPPRRVLRHAASRRPCGRLPAM